MKGSSKVKKLVRTVSVLVGMLMILNTVGFTGVFADDGQSITSVFGNAVSLVSGSGTADDPYVYDIKAEYKNKTLSAADIAATGDVTLFEDVFVSEMNEIDLTQSYGKTVYAKTGDTYSKLNLCSMNISVLTL